MSSAGGFISIIYYAHIFLNISGRIMQKIFYQLLFWGTLVSVSACGEMSVKDIESLSYRGYCKNDGGQDLTADQCNQKMMREMSSKSHKSESDTMIQNINEDIKTKK
jgi:hypothetical protein